MSQDLLWSVSLLKDLQSSEITLCFAMMVDTCHYVFVQIHKMPNMKNELYVNSGLNYQTAHFCCPGEFIPGTSYWKIQLYYPGDV